MVKQEDAKFDEFFLNLNLDLSSPEYKINILYL